MDWSHNCVRTCSKYVHNKMLTSFWNGRNPRVECQLHGYSLTSMKYDDNRSSIARQLTYSRHRKKWGVYMADHRGGGGSSQQAAASGGGLGSGPNSGSPRVFHECSIDAQRPPGIVVRPCTGKRIVADCPAPTTVGQA